MRVIGDILLEHDRSKHILFLQALPSDHVAHGFRPTTIKREHESLRRSPEPRIACTFDYFSTDAEESVYEFELSA